MSASGGMEIPPAAALAAASAARPQPFGAPLLRARMRTRPEDFRVDELDGFAPTGEGEHLLLRIEKTGQTSAEVSARLQAWAGIGDVGIGMAGMKDRHAVTTQRFSVHLPKRVAPDLAALEGDGLRVLEHGWHARKLGRGALAGNRFALALRGIEALPGAGGDLRAAVAARLADIVAAGLPNYFGGQRFGRGGDNLQSAARMFAGRRVKRAERSILLSAARSAIFNAVLAERVRRGDWRRGGAGEVWMLEGSHSVFGPQDLDDALAARVDSLDLHPTGPLWGAGVPRTAGALQALETACAEAFGPLKPGLEAAGLRQERRALRIRLAAIEHAWDPDGTLRLAFALPPGAYATGVFEALGDVAEAPRGGAGEGTAVFAGAADGEVDDDAG